MAWFALDVLEPHIRAWGGWSTRGGAFWKYIDVNQQPTEGEFRLWLDDALHPGSSCAFCAHFPPVM